MSDHPQTLGRYRLLSLIGEGGMGKVYKAHDPSLDRHVAIKILPSGLDSSRVQRFMQEARAASALNHPHVIAVYDVGEADNVRYIAMELIEGRTLRDLAGSGPIDLRKVLKVVTQVAEALTAAHGSSIIHRDLKPENVMVTSAGYAKVLDFGLAKLRTSESSGDSLTQVKDTEPGTVMGTVGYMSPEQALGKPVDHRSDIFSLGCILYELVGGQRAFQGDSSVDTLHKIIHSDPKPIRTLRVDVPQELIRIIRKALAKDPDDRYQTAKDLAIDLRELLRDFDSAPLAVAALPKRRWVGPAIVMAILAIALGVMAIAKRDADRRNAEAASQKTQEGLRITRITASGKVIAGAISSDGKFLAFNVSDQGEQSLWVRQMTSGQSLLLIPPSRVAYWGLSFSPDGSIYYGVKSARDRTGAIYQISPLGGTPRKVIENIDSPPTFSPDGKQMAFLRAGFPSAAESAIIIANVDGTAERTLTAVKAPQVFVPVFYAAASWSPDGKTIATAILDRNARAGRLVAVNVAAASITTIAQGDWTQVGQVAWMPDGNGLVAVATRPEDSRGQVWFVQYPSGERKQITRDLFDYRIVNVTADGLSLMTVASDISADVWVQKDGGEPRKITRAKFEGGNGLASLPGGQIALTSLETGKSDLWLMKSDGSDRTPLTRDDLDNRWPVASPDGRFIVYAARTPKGFQICAINTDGSNRRVIAATMSIAYPHSLSPDGKWVAYTTFSKASNSEFLVERVPIQGGTPEALSSGFAPSYSPDGRYIAMYQFGGGVIVIPAAGGKPVRELKTAPAYYSSRIAWTTDGKSLLLNTAPSDRANLWEVPVDGGALRRITNFDDHNLLTFARLHENDGWIFSRGDLSRDAVLITGFR